MICTFSGSVSLRTVPQVGIVNIDTAFIDLNTGDVTVTFDDGTSNVVVTKFVLDAPRLSSIQTFVKTKLSNKYGVTVT